MKTSTSNKINKALDKVVARKTGAVVQAFVAGELLREQIEELESAISNLEDLCNGMEYGEDYRIVID